MPPPRGRRPGQRAGGAAGDQRVVEAVDQAPAPPAPPSAALTAARNSAEPGSPREYQDRCLRASRSPAPCRNGSVSRGNGAARSASARPAPGRPAARRCAGNARPGRGTRAGRSSRGRSSPHRRRSAPAPRRHPPRVAMSPLTITGMPTPSFTRRDEIPVGGAGVEHLPGAAVHRDHADAALLGDARQPRGRSGWRGPSPCASSASPAAATARTVASRMRAAAASSRISALPALWPTATFFTGQPKLMSTMSAPRSDRNAGRLGHRRRVAAGQLDAPTGRAVQLGHAQRGAVLPHHRPGGDHLRHHQPGAEFARQPAERQVGDARHGCEDHRRVEPDARAELDRAQAPEECAVRCP